MPTTTPQWSARFVRRLLSETSAVPERALSSPPPLPPGMRPSSVPPQGAPGWRLPVAAGLSACVGGWSLHQGVERAQREQTGHWASTLPRPPVTGRPHCLGLRSLGVHTASGLHLGLRSWLVAFKATDFECRWTHRGWGRPPYMLPPCYTHPCPCPCRSASAPSAAGPWSGTSRTQLS